MTVLEYLKSKNITQFNDAASLMMGKRVKIRVLTGSKYGKKGDIFTISAWENPNSHLLSATTNGCLLKELRGMSSFAVLNSLDMVNCDTIPGLKEEISLNLAEIEKLQAVNVQHQQKIDFMTENGLESFDEDEFKVFAVLKQLSNKKTSEIEKAKAIAKLIKGS